MISKDDLTFGSRSGIQKAVRRGDLDLVKTCLDVLWDIPAQSNWLKWRVYTIVIEEAPYMAGELSKVVNSEATKQDWYKFFFSLALVPKAKEHIALM